MKRSPGASRVSHHPLREQSSVFAATIAGDPVSDDAERGSRPGRECRDEIDTSPDANSMSSRLPVAGTIPRSQPIHVGDQLVYPWQNSPVTTGLVTGTTNFVEINPLPVTDELLQRGEQVFNINCAACHSKLGDGNGVPKRIGAMAVVANLHDKRIVELADGELFNTVSYGRGLMQGYGANLPIQDRWAAISYLRALQLSRLGSLDEVPEALRGKLKK